MAVTSSAGKPMSLEQLRQREFCVPPLTNTLKGVLWSVVTKRRPVDTSKTLRVGTTTPTRSVATLGRRA